MPFRTYKGLWGATPLPFRTYKGLRVRTRFIRAFTGFCGAPTPSKARTYMGLGMNS